jgi:hypothetical protein
MDCDRVFLFKLILHNACNPRPMIIDELRSNGLLHVLVRQLFLFLGCDTFDERILFPFPGSMYSIGPAVFDGFNLSAASPRNGCSVNKYEAITPSRFLILFVPIPHFVGVIIAGDNIH